MTIPVAKRLAVRLVGVVGVTLLLFSAVVGVLSYRHAYQHEMWTLTEVQDQIVRTVQVQAEIAAFASNAKIAHEVLEGLLVNPMIRAARIEAGPNFVYETGAGVGVNFAQGRSFPLYSPVDRRESIGRLVLVQNAAVAQRAAEQSALLQTALMLAQVLAAAVILLLVLRRMVFAPIARLAPMHQIWKTTQPRANPCQR